MVGLACDTILNVPLPNSEDLTGLHMLATTPALWFP